MSSDVFVAENVMTRTVKLIVNHLRNLIGLLLITGIGLCSPTGIGFAQTKNRDVVSDIDDWKAAESDYILSFPRDHAAHPDHKIEWWYYTGNVTAAGGREFGYQLTFFRFGVRFNPLNPSRWAVRDLYLAHFAVTDVSRSVHHFDERLNRAGVGWAGASRQEFHVWNDDWRTRMEGTVHHLEAVSSDLEFSIDLRLDGNSEPILHGRDGFSQKGDDVRNASHYYSLTRLETLGRLTVGGETFDVSGSSWMDHEFGSSFLEPSQVGWDWFSVQLDDDTELMLYQLRRSDGRLDLHSAGTLVLNDGAVYALGASDYELTAGSLWTSDSSGAIYPVDWRIRIPSHGMSLSVTAVVDDQELETDRSTGVTYWEGVIEVAGTSDGVPISGKGYLEMTGYSGPPLSTVLR